MQINLKEIVITNFKGIKTLTLDLSNAVTNIYGQNASGKSTIADAFIWLLFNKNSSDKTDFSIKTLDRNNKAIPKIDHSVQATFAVDDIEIELMKVYREKWEVKNGETEEVFTGNETKCFVDGVPVSKGEYDKKVQSVIDPTIFKLVTNPLYFNTNLKWQERRKILSELSPNIADADIIAENPTKFNPMTEILQKYKVDDYKKKLRDGISKIQEQLNEIPARVDEAYRSMPVPVDENALRTEIQLKNKLLADLDKQITDVSLLFTTYNKQQQEIFYLQSQQKELANKFELNFQTKKHKKQAEIEDLKRELVDLEKNFISHQNLVSSLQEKIRNQELHRKELLEKWHFENNKVLEFNNQDFVCPTCKRELEIHDIGEQKAHLTENFKLNKSKMLTSISVEGKAMKSETEKTQHLISSTTEVMAFDEKQIKQKTESLEQQQALFNSMKIPNVEDTKEYQELQKKIGKLQGDLALPGANTNEISVKKLEIVAEIDVLKKQLLFIEIIEKTKIRINELQDQEKELASTKAKYQKELQLCDDFTKLKIEKIEQNINKMFKYVTFKLFNEQVNGGEVECCEVLIDGVPFVDANSAAQINAGLDVVNAISKFYDVKAPIFIDNRESITELISCDTQIINLFVSKEDAQLRVEAA